MFKVQEYLHSGGSIDGLVRELGIVPTFHPELPLVILNYSQLNSPRDNEIARECRGLVLELDTWNLVARGFKRFFNWGEFQDEAKSFDFTNFTTQTKHDGSFISIYCYQDKWLINTSGTFGDFFVNDFPVTWENCVLSALGLKSVDELSFLNPDLTYIGEFCSIYNKVVRQYDKPVFYLTTVFKGEEELSVEECDTIAEGRFLRPELHSFSSVDEILLYLEKQMVADPTFEGLVIRDINNMRYKLKSQSYFALHRMKGNNNIWNVKYLLPVILSGEIYEIMTYFQEVKPILEFYQKQVNDIIAELNDYWNKYKDLESQYEFAKAIKNNSFCYALFQARKHGKTPEYVFRNEMPHWMILKRLKKYTKDQ